VKEEMKSGSYKSSKSSIPLLPFSLMDRYIASELLPPFLFGVGAFSSIIMAIDALFELVRKVVEAGLPPTIALQIFALKLPYVIVFSFPMSTMLSSLMTYSRLSSDSELIAMRSCGVSVYRLVLPSIVLSFLVAGMTFFFNEAVVPATNYQATQTLQRALKEKPSFKQQNIWFPQYRDKTNASGKKEKVLSHLFYADTFDGELMRGLTILDRSREGVNQIVVAESAGWNPSLNIWDFYNGTIYLVNTDNSYRSIARFKHQELKLPRTPLTLAQNKRDFNEMNIVEAQQQLDVIRLSGDAQQVRKLKVRIQQKVAIPFVCVVFGLVGATMGTKPQRTGRGTSFGVSVVIIFSYYLLYFITGEVATAGAISPFLGAWLPNFFGLAAGGWMLFRIASR